MARAAAIAGFPELARELGASPEQLLAEHGLCVDILSNPENVVPLMVIDPLLQAAADRSGCAHFGLLLGQRQDPAVLGILLLLMQQKTSLREGLAAAQTHFHIHNLGAEIGVHVDGDVAELSYEVWLPDGRRLGQGLPLAMAVGYKLLKLLCGPSWSALEVHFACARPADTLPYLRYFGAPSYFDQPRTGIFFHARWLDQPIAVGNPLYSQVIDDFLQRNKSMSAIDWRMQVRRLIRTLLPFGRADIDHAARAYGISRRTLHRRLAETGDTFAGLLDEVRFEMIDQLLTRRDMPLSEIATMTGFSDSTAFSRACRRRWGVPPSQRREDLGASAEPSAKDAKLA